jgi:hypothetical protein
MMNVSLVQIDFSSSNFFVVKQEPPKEYQGLGKSLSTRRNKEAETGQSHVTASKLGALFDGVIPSTPDLIRAYGSRCSEIASSQTFNPPGTQRHGLFANQVGADGTTIWAAATSGTSAIAVHLLACMLARMWDSPKAISIWSELIAIRKQALNDSGKPMDYHAARIELSRDQLANWDSSARAWLLTADQANERRQKQLLLIIDHMGIPVSGKLELGESVIDAWRSAMTTVNKLVAGEPQSVQTGAPLLGLASWHLYPDMVVFGKDNEVKEAKQRDPLIHPGGILTLGIEDTRRQGDGIYWSLPLAHLRYYGDPVQLEACLHSQTSRVSMDQLLHVALGSLIRRWCAEFNEIEHATELLVKLSNFLEYESDTKDPQAWLPLLASAAREFLASKGAQRSEILRLIKCGRRRYPTFVDHTATKSIFGLSDCKTFLNMLPSNASRIACLREVAKDFSDDQHFMVIQYVSDLIGSEYELASVAQLPGDRKKRSLGVDKPLRKFLAWYRRRISENSFNRKIASESFPVDGIIPYFFNQQGYDWQDAPSIFYSKFLVGIVAPEVLSKIRGATVRTRFLFGDQRTAALYAISITHWTISPNEDPRTCENEQLRILPNIFIMRHVLWSLEQKLLNQQLLFSYLTAGKYSAEPAQTVGDVAILKSLKGLLTVWKFYQSLPSATVELKVASDPLCGHQWIPQGSILADTLGAFDLSEEQTFACVAKFESGNFNFQPSSMRGVHAISIGNSLYIAKCLLQDPCERSTALVERVVGNLGKSGMAMLTSPAVPRVRPMTYDYSLVNHHPFDGSEANCFQHTTLHMSFTDWTLPIDTGSRGIRDIEAYYIEAAISVFDHGKWVADVNIPDIFRHQISRIIPECTIRHDSQLPKRELHKFVAIESWEELLDSPPEIGVVRTRGNWQARLAAAALSIQRGHETRILPEPVCWTCCVALPAVPKAKQQEEDRQDDDEHISLTNDAIGALNDSDMEEDSDSDMDEVAERKQAIFMRQQKGGPGRLRSDLQTLTSRNISMGVSNSNRNILYIL